MLQPLRAYYTPQEYLFMERQADYKSEYYNGQIYSVGGCYTANHSFAAEHLIAELNIRLRDQDYHIFNHDLRVGIDTNSTSQFIAYPDLSVVHGQTRYYDEQRDTITNPVAIIEVLSPSTRMYDRSTKFERYRHLASLQVYVIVDPERVFIEYYRKLEDNIWNLRTIEDMTATLNIEPLDVQIPVARIYNKLRLPSENQV